MTTFVVGNIDEALEALRLLAAEEPGRVKIRFKDFKKTLASPEPFEELARSKFFIAMQRAIHREHCWIKYGGPNLHRLTDADRRATRIGVRTSADGRRIEYDLSAALNAHMEAAEAWGGSGPPQRLRTQDLFASRGGPNSGWAAATAVGKDLVAKLSPGNVLAAVKMLIVMGALAHAAPGVVHEALEFVGQRKDAAIEQQYRMALAERTTVVTYDGREAKLDSKDRLEVERQIESKRQLAQALISDNIDEPLVRFVVAEAESTRPALLDMAPAWGTLTIDGMPIDANAAKTGAKLLRRQLKDRATNGWETEIFIGAKRA